MMHKHDSSMKEKSSSNREVMDGSDIMELVENDKVFSNFVDHKFQELDVDCDGKLSRKELQPAVDDIGAAIGLPAHGSSPESDHIYSQVLNEFTHGKQNNVGKSEFKEVLSDFLLGMATGLKRDPVVILRIDGEDLHEFVNGPTFEPEILSIFSEIALPSGCLKDYITKAFEKLTVDQGMPPVTDPWVVSNIIEPSLGGDLNEPVTQETFLTEFTRAAENVARLLKEQPAIVAHSQNTFDGSGIKKLLSNKFELEKTLDSAIKGVPKDRNGKISKEYLGVVLDSFAASAGLPPLGAVDQVSSPFSVDISEHLLGSSLRLPKPTTFDIKVNRIGDSRNQPALMASMDERGKRKAASGPRRVWTFTEERELVHALKDLVTRGLKCDNGFKAGYLGLLQNSMARAFPGIDLKGDPHINSKMHVWKKQYNCLKTMLNISGIGLNSTTYQIEALPEVWEAHIKADPTANSLRNKSFPFYHDWVEIFGNDRANGSDAQAYADAVQYVINNKNTKLPKVSTGFEEAGDTPDTPVMDESMNAEFASCNRGESSSATKDRGKGVKRKIDDALLDTISNFCELTGSGVGQIAHTMGNIAQRIGSEYDATKKRGEVYECLGSLDFLGVDEKVYVAQYLCNNSKELDLFFSLPDEAKSSLVKNVLNKYDPNLM